MVPLESPESRGADLWERDERLDALYRRPGFMLRRAHQIAVGIFAEECGAFDLTTTQHGILTALQTFPALDQISLGRLLGLDRSTVGTVVKRLEERGLIRREVSGEDKRRRELHLAPAGEQLLAAAGEAATRASERLLSAFTPLEAQMLLGLLTRLTEVNNAATRVPLRADIR
ncbi:MAG TPA: MarR family transcriptional regulator [Candidatus Limnocylindria bacterium]|jgi:DNA-binding MarR family transcriptional regulator|nr:MarR family transcriptional regulator [Candidatus Limnocylindria bacterium]